MSLSDFELRLWLRETLACQLYESNVRKEGTLSMPAWYMLERREQDTWRSRAAALITDEVRR